MAAEKGIEFLLQALPIIQDRYPSTMILQIGPREPIGESTYSKKLEPLIDEIGDTYQHLGAIPGEDLPAFYGVCDLNVLPSLNNTETFGMVQIEAAYCGTPSVASDLPGVRVPTEITGMGLTSVPANPISLATSIIKALDNIKQYQHSQIDLINTFSPQSVAEKYEKLFLDLLNRN